MKNSQPVNKRILLVMICSIFAISMGSANAQEVQLATFQEMAQVVVDTTISNNVTASITLQSTSNQEMKIPSELESKILENGKIIAVVITNEENCILGVYDESCILINVQRAEEWEGIIETQDETKKIGNLFIDEINEFFDTNAQYHSSFLHHRDEANVALGTSGVISGRDTVSAVFTMPMEATDSMYEKLSALLLPQLIRESGGFYDVAKELSHEDNAKMTFSMIPQGAGSLYQLKLSVDYTNADEISSEIKPLEFLKTKKIERSDYFSQGFYPLNSLIQVAILGDDAISKTIPDFIDTELRNGVLVPTNLKQFGWVPDQNSEEMKEVVFLFGEKTSANENELKIILDSAQNNVEPKTQEEFDESLVVVGIIAAGAIGAAIFFLKGYRKGP